MHKDTELTTNRLKYDSARVDHPSLPTQRYDLDQTGTNMLLEAQGEDEEEQEEEA
jgi:hypothetical protein